MKNEWLKINEAAKILNKRLGEKRFSFKILKKKIEDSELWAINISDPKSPVWRIKREWLEGFYSSLTNEFKPSKTEKEEAILSLLSEKLGEELSFKKLKKLVKRLPKRERKIIELRYGLKDGTYKSLGTIAKDFNTSRQVIWFYEKQAIEKLKEICRKKQKKKSK